MISGGDLIGSSAGMTGGGVSGGDCGSIVSGSGISGLLAMSRIPVGQSAAVVFLFQQRGIGAIG